MATKADFTLCHPERSVTQSKDLPPPKAPPMAQGTPNFLPRLAAAGRKVLRLRYTPLRMTTLQPAN